MGNNIQSSHIKKSVTTVNLNIKFKWLFQWKFKSFTKERVYIMTLKYIYHIIEYCINSLHLDIYLTSTCTANL